MNAEAKILKAEDGTRLTVLGDHQRIMLSGKDTNNQFTLIEQWNDPGIGVPKHVHANEDEVFHVLEGTVEFHIEDTVQTLKAGELTYVPRGVAHRFTVVGDAKAKVHLSIFPAGIERMFEELNQLPPGPPDFARITQICASYGVTILP
ncbi:cupin domain-containing protein [Hymenobacter radiodurans]|uniref:cupin domain-containing protein n=1 Tax=Hymenobacter radiodurans TaxID=2496028 RepID=UPI0010588569|nr:cupin domain-containing protein [Hymenobacter radiodurans]